MSRPVAERRAYPRQPVRLPGLLMPTDGMARPCELRDFCPAGLLVVVAGPESGDLSPGAEVTIHALAVAGGGSHELRFRGRIVRANDSGIGISLLEPDPAGIQALQTLAREQQPAPSPAAAAQDPKRVAAARDILAECAGLFGERSRQIMAAFLDDFPDQLMAAAEAETSSREQMEFYAAASSFRKQSEILQAVFEEGLRALPGDIAPARPHTSEGEPEIPEDLSLVDDSDLEHWLARTETERRVENRHHALLTLLERQLQQLTGHVVTSANNPFAPGVLVQAFQRALGALPLERRVEMLAFTVFSRHAAERAGDLYLALKDLLTSRGVALPAKPEPHSPGAKTNGADQPRETNTGDRADETNAAPGQGRPAAVSGAPGQAQTADPGTGVADQGVGAMTPAPSPEAGRRGGGAEARDAGGEEGVFGLLDVLQRLKDEALAAPARTAEPTAPDAARPSTATYTREEILQALSRLEAAGQGRALSQQGDLSEALLSALREQDSRRPPARLEPAEARRVSVLGNLMQRVLENETVAAPTRTCLQRLEPVLLQLALNDETFLRDRQHAARRFVNDLARLDLSGGEANRRQLVESLIERVRQDFDGDSQVFEQALEPLRDITSAQHRRYADNIRGLLSELHNDKALYRYPRPTEQALQALSNEERIWLRHAERLGPGGTVCFDDRDSPRRLRLGWTNDAHSYFVFVDDQGRREREEPLLDLARLLARGQAEIATGVDEEPIDRAQFSLLQDVHAEFRQFAIHDPLTGAYNWREFERRCREALAACHSEQAVHSLCHLDIDHFRAINTRYGREAGDELLVWVYGVLRGLGEDVVVARLASDEFGILFERQGLDGSLPRLRQWLASLDEQRFKYKGVDIDWGVHASLIELDDSSTELDDFMRAVENGSRMAKSRGHNTVQTVQLDQIAYARQRTVMQLASNLAALLEEGRFTLVCQEISALVDEGEAPPHYEVLLRFTDQEGAPVSAGELVMAAEEYHTIHLIDRWVVREALRWMARHRERLDRIHGLSINLSGQSIGDGNFLDYVLEQLAAADVPAEKVCFEVTETAGVASLGDAAAFVLAIKDTGCRFSLDDFGTGMSSYAYLKNLPVDYLKIDGTFIKDMVETPSDYAMVKSITEIGHFMNMKIIAEYVENDAIIEALREIGVDYGQGHGIARPVPIDDIIGDDA